MPKNLDKALKNRSKVFHPNSRRAGQLTKKSQRLLKVEKIKKRKLKKSSKIVDKLMWFRDVIDETMSCYTLEEVLETIDLFDDQLLLYQEVKGPLASHYRLQHAGKREALHSVIATEREQFNTVGIEIPDLTNKEVFKEFLDWSGEACHIPKLQMRKFVFR